MSLYLDKDRRERGPRKRSLPKDSEQSTVVLSTQTDKGLGSPFKVTGSPKKALGLPVVIPQIAFNSVNV